MEESRIKCKRPGERHPDWQRLYEEQDIKEMPWFSPKLDSDLAQELQSRGLSRGAFLDVGCGAGTQSVELWRMGFEVTATDLSAAAVAIAARNYPGPAYLQDDILETRLTERFDFVLDRGCLHVLPPEKYGQYFHNVARLLNPGGLLFLKVFSTAEPERPFGPLRFSREEIEKLSSECFSAELIRPGSFQEKGASPATWFCVLKRKTPAVKERLGWIQWH